ncbi:ATP-dependent nuclease [Micrococcus sp. HOU01]|uniref:ATP-dependent nuclease n=1 Tax=Micrococcus sp. HOU01 TaxID=3101753 RepID=UPI002D76F738|nr:AAA family ATPase [Micrococcus sp. HOU1]WRQ42650.1 AAA family ATPase [Micrococcus sp. HOU1]
MRLSQIKITGHAVLEDLEISVREHLVIVGGNDVGKTSILRLLHMLLGASTQQLYQSVHPEHIREGSEALVVEARLEDFSEDEASQFPYQMSIREGDPDYLSLRLEVTRIEGDADNVLIDRYYPDSGNRRQPTRDQLTAIGWQYLPADRSNSAEYMEGKRSAFRMMLDSVEVGDDREALEEILESFNGTLADNDALLTLRTEIAGHLSRAVPRSFEAENLTIRTAADPHASPLDGATLYLREGDNYKALGDQSDGMRQLMALTFFDLAQSTANIVAVDEPEIHLHAASQRTVAALFAASKKQRIVVTHSPYVVQRFEPKHVLVVSPFREVKQIPEANFNAVDKERIHWWSPQLLEGLTARKLLFVEGAADRVIVEAVATNAGVSLDRAGVSVFALDGADKFKKVLEIVGTKGFDLPLSGLCDEDREHAWAGTLGVKPENLSKNGFFVARADLEHEYVRLLGARVVADELISSGIAREQGLLNASGEASLDDLTEEQVADFITTKDSRKIPAARVIAPLLTPAAIASSDALNGLVQHVKAMIS